MSSISIFDIFKVGIGPSSSHTLGPWKAASVLYCIAIFILLSSCAQVEPQEIQVLQEIINIDFRDCPTYHRLIPIKIQEIKEYDKYKKESNAIVKRKEMQKVESKSYSNPSVEIPIGFLPFSSLIRNSQISKIQYREDVEGV